MKATWEELQLLRGVYDLLEGAFNRNCAICAATSPLDSKGNPVDDIAHTPTCLIPRLRDLIHETLKARLAEDLTAANNMRVD